MIRSKIIHIAWIVSALIAGLSKAESLPFDGLDDIRGPFEGTGIRGDAFYMLALGNAAGLPIRAYWSSANVGSSSVLGFGWSIPAFESRFIPLDEGGRWAFHQPDGYVRIFTRSRRKKAGPSAEKEFTLYGGPAWRAQVKGRRVTVTADPGDGGAPSKFHFQNGRLVRMSCEEGDFEFKYIGRKFDQIVSQGETAVKFIPAGKGKEESALVINEKDGVKRIAVVLRPAAVFARREKEETPRTDKRNCLSSLALPGREKLEFSYGSDPENVTFTAGDSQWTWDARTGFIKSHNGWNYDIAAPKTEFDEPRFFRENAAGDQEIHWYERSKGRLLRKFRDGSMLVRQMHTSGHMAYRRVRFERRTNPDGSVRDTEFDWDEQGRLFCKRVTSNESGEEKTEEFFYGKEQESK